MAKSPARLTGSLRSRWLWLLNRGLIALLLLLGIGMLMNSSGGPPWARAISGAALDLMAPVLSAVRAPFDGLARASAMVKSFWRLRARNLALEAQLARTRPMVERFAMLERENQQLRLLAKLGEKRPDIVGQFRIVGASPSAPARLAILDGGAQRGLAVGQPARDANGLVGRVIDVGQMSARVLLLTDVSSRVPVRVQRTGQTALVVGLNERLLAVRYLSGSRPLRPGDQLVTSSDGGIYPPGIPVGQIVALTASEARAQPASEPNGLDLVLVYRPFVPEAIAPAPIDPAAAVPAPVDLRPPAPAAPAPCACAAATATAGSGEAPRQAAAADASAPANGARSDAPETSRPADGR